MEKQRNLVSSQTSFQFCLENELSKHAWFPKMTDKEAEQALKGQPAYTYLLRKSQNNLRKYDISFVDAEGRIHHDTFTLINPKLGIWRNFYPNHLGKLEKVVRDMMECEAHEGQPLSTK